MQSTTILGHASRETNKLREESTHWRSWWDMIDAIPVDLLQEGCCKAITERLLDHNISSGADRGLELVPQLAILESI